MVSLFARVYEHASYWLRSNEPNARCVLTNRFADLLEVSPNETDCDQSVDCLQNHIFVAKRSATVRIGQPVFPISRFVSRSDKGASGAPFCRARATC